MAGITSAVKMVEQYGRGPDTMLAHISPDEAALIDHLQGGRRVNPHTGLAEYGLFGKILKGVARAAAGIGGFMVGGPAGAAAATAAATKLTGGSWKDAAVGGALGGIGAGLGNMASGTGFMGTTGLGGAAANSVPLSQLGQVASQTTLPTGLAASLGGMTSGIGGLGGLGAGIGGFMAEPRGQAQGMDFTPPAPDANITYPTGAMPTREYVGPEGDLTQYGLRGGEHQFYRPRVNVPALGMAKGGAVQRYADGGRITPPADAAYWDSRGDYSPQKHASTLMADLERIGQAIQIQEGVIDPKQTADRQRSMATLPRDFLVQWQEQILQELGAAENAAGKRLTGSIGNYAKGGRASRAVVRSGISQAARMGTVRGPGDGQEDKIPAMLSDNEHVIDAGTVALAGNGSSDAGHRVIEKFKRDIRSKAGLKKPSVPPKRVRAAHA